ncbi:hypothetical protein EDB19DRAFT_1962019 [Suillus lakei]|nr:hypothetical protein EDB19DRAFT_1962019 [Suillus lakei]
MDPITSGLTVLQVVQTLAQASALLLGYVASIHDADLSCQNLLNELRSIGGVLTTGELENLLPPQESRKMGVRDKLTWPCKEKRVTAIIDKLKGYCGEITKILAINTCIRITLKEVKHGVQGLIEDSAAQKVHEKASHHQCNPESGHWIFHNNEYVIWNKSDSTFLWLNGQFPPLSMGFGVGEKQSHRHLLISIAISEMIGRQ